MEASQQNRFEVEQQYKRKLNDIEQLRQDVASLDCELETIRESTIYTTLDLNTETNKKYEIE